MHPYRSNANEIMTISSRDFKPTDQLVTFAPNDFSESELLKRFLLISKSKRTKNCPPIVLVQYKLIEKSSDVEMFSKNLV